MSELHMLAPPALAQGQAHACKAFEVKNLHSMGKVLRIGVTNSSLSSCICMLQQQLIANPRSRVLGKGAPSPTSDLAASQCQPAR
jgi:hypothetical protein